MDYKSFINDDKTLAASAFALGQIGECVNNIDIEVQKSNTHIPWNSIRGFRNRIIHDYDNINYKVLWNVVSEDLPVLYI